MGKTLDSVVGVQITITSAFTTAEGFGIPMILGEPTWFPVSERVRTYTSPAAMLADGASETDEEYLMALDLYGQEISPKYFYVGRKAADVNAKWTYVFDAVATSGTYTITVGTAVSSAIAFDAAAGAIETAIEAISGVTSVTVTENVASKSYTVEFDGADAATAFDTFSVDVSGLSGGGVSSVTVTADQYGSATETWTAGLAAVRAVQDNWYDLQTTLKTAGDQSDIEALAAVMATLNKMFSILTTDSACLTTSTSCITAVIKANSYENCFCIYKGNSDYAQSALSGRCLPRVPGSITWEGRKLQSVTADTLSDTAVTNLEAQNCSYIVEIGGQVVAKGGQKSGSGEQRDIIRTKHYLIAKIQENVFNMQTNVEKIPFTNPGIASYEASVRSTLYNEGVKRKSLVEGSIKITTVSREDTSAVDRAAREYNGLAFSADLAGAIESTKFTGTLVV